MNMSGISFSKVTSFCVKLLLPIFIGFVIYKIYYWTKNKDTIFSCLFLISSHGLIK